MLIEIRDATIWRGSTCVFEHLSLDIEQHERVAILGPDGSKSEVLTSEILSTVYETAIRVAEVDGFFLAYPGRS